MVALNRRLARDVDRAFPELVREYQDRLFSTALRFTRSSPEAEDITQESFVRAYQALQGYETTRIQELRLRPWLWTIALNVARNRARTSSRRPHEVALGDHEPAAAADPESQASIATDVERALGRLPEVQQRVLVLRYIGDLSISEIAEVAKLPEGTIKSHIHRGLAALRRSVEHQEAR